MSAHSIFARICAAESRSPIRNNTSVLHFRKPPKYSRTLSQYTSESELAVGTKSSFGFFFPESRIISRSIAAVPWVMIIPRQSPQLPSAYSFSENQPSIFSLHPQWHPCLSKDEKHLSDRCRWRRRTEHP